jgi:hypothetical protein
MPFDNGCLRFWLLFFRYVLFLTVFCECLSIFYLVNLALDLLPWHATVPYPLLLSAPKTTYRSHVDIPFVPVRCVECSASTHWLQILWTLDVADRRLISCGYRLLVAAVHISIHWCGMRLFAGSSCWRQTRNFSIDHVISNPLLHYWLAHCLPTLLYMNSYINKPVHYSRQLFRCRATAL